jgi:hypothetical protein
MAAALAKADEEVGIVAGGCVEVFHLPQGRENIETTEQMLRLLAAEI